MPVKFYLDNRPNKKGDFPIKVSIVIEKERLLTSAGFSISPEKWNADTQKVKNKYSNASGQPYTLINSRLSDIEAYFAKIEAQCKLDKTVRVNIKELFAERYGRKKDEPKEEKSFFEYMAEFTAEMGKENNWTIAVYDKFKALENHLRAFNENLTFDDLGKDGLNDFVDYLHSVLVAGKLYKDRDTRVFGMRNSTIKKQMGFLKWFLRWAVNKGYATETAFQTFAPKLKKTETQVVFLEWEELMTIYNYAIPEQKKYLDRVRDVFCFQCFTSLRYSDVANLKKSDIHENLIRIVTVKTADAITIDLNDYSRTILNKYANDVYPNNKALPVVSNQRMNEYLKELGELCGIDTPVTITYYKGNDRYDEVYPKYGLIGTHTGRRTFISNALMMGIPPQVVMKWTGHSDYKAMKPYIDIADKAKAEEMTKFNR